MWLAGIPKDVKDQRYADKVCMRCGEKNHRWWDCPHDKPVLPRTLTISSAKRRRDEDSEEESPPAKRVVGSASRRTVPLSARISSLPLAARVAIPEPQAEEMNVITDGEESDIDIYD